VSPSCGCHGLSAGISHPYRSRVGLRSSEATAEETTYPERGYGMLSPVAVLTAFCTYMGVLLLTCLWVERKYAKGESPANNPVVYSLSLAVYCTAWTYYGSVGNAATAGLTFLAVYLGPTISVVLWWTVLRKLVRIKTKYHITSIADFISARYDKSQAVAALATLIALVGAMPYIALQFKAVISTFSIITTSGTAADSSTATIIGPIVALLMFLFTVMLGMRRLDPTERHPGLVMAVAAESVVKLVAFLLAGVFVTYFMFNGFGDIFSRMLELPEDIPLMETASPVTWITVLVLSMSAILFLPRQFHVTVVENFDERHFRTAMWLFPLYMLLINLFVLPIAFGGLLIGYPAQAADTFVLALPLDAGHKALSLLVFIGGASAATGMIMVSSITLATMVTNHFLLPAIGWVPSLGFLRRHLLKCRWVAVATVIGIGCWFERQMGLSYMLVGMGLISFAAVLQFAPALLGGIFWRAGNRAGALLGLTAGFLTWLYTSLLPAFVRGGWLSDTLLTNGPWGIRFFKPEKLFGVSTLEPLSHTVFWSLLFNIGLYVVGSLLFRQSPEDRKLARDFVGALSRESPGVRSGQPAALIDLKVKKAMICDVLADYFPRSDAALITEACAHRVGLKGKERVPVTDYAELYGQVERLLGGSIGAPAAHKALTEAGIFTRDDAKELAEVYAEILADLKVTPEELRRKIDYYQEREALLTRTAAELEEQVQERTLDLEAANRELKEFAYVVSHDLKAPLRGITQLAQWITQDYADVLDEEGKKQLNMLLGRAKRMHNLIDGVLQYSRIGRIKEDEREVDLNQLVRDVIDILAPPAHIRITVESSLPLLICGETRFKQLFQNLLDNAVKFMDKAEGEIKIACVRDNSHFRFSVADNGPGIDEKYHEKIFQIFQTLASRDRSESTGIGLSLVKKIVELGGGKIWLESQMGNGTTFFFTVPAAWEVS
jgi:Na+/proline symporter/signal transduction histidine kinase